MLFGQREEDGKQNRQNADGHTNHVKNLDAEGQRDDRAVLQAFHELVLRDPLVLAKELGFRGVECLKGEAVAPKPLVFASELVISAFVPLAVSVAAVDVGLVAEDAVGVFVMDLVHSVIPLELLDDVLALLHIKTVSQIDEVENDRNDGHKDRNQNADPGVFREKGAVERDRGGKNRDEEIDHRRSLLGVIVKVGAGLLIKIGIR